MDKGTRTHDNIYLDNKEFKNKQIFQDIFNQIKPKNGDSFIDIGCSNGSFINYILKLVHPNSRVVGVDIDNSLLEKAKSNVTEANFVRHDIKNLAPDSLSAKFDYAFMIGVHTIFDDLEPLLKSCKSFLKSNGELFISGSFSKSNYDLITRVRKSGNKLLETGFNRHSLNSLHNASLKSGFSSFEAKPFYMKEKIYKTDDDPLRSYHSKFCEEDFSKSILQNGIELLCNQYIVSIK